MAYISNNNPDNVQGMNQKKPEDQQQSSMTPPTLSGQSATSDAGQPQQNQQMQPQQPARPGAAPTSGARAGFQQYQQANQGIATNRLAQSVQKNIASSANQANRATQQSQTAFGQRMDQGTLANRQNALTDVGTAVKQASNIYTGNIEEDRAKQQANLTGAQQSAEQVRQQRQAEADRIAREQGRAQQMVQQAEQDFDQLKRTSADALKQYKTSSKELGLDYSFITNPEYTRALGESRGPVDTNRIPMHLAQYYNFDNLNEQQKRDLAGQLGFGASQQQSGANSVGSFGAPGGQQQNQPSIQDIDKFLFDVSLKKDFVPQAPASYQERLNQSAALQKELEEAAKLNAVNDTRISGFETQAEQAKKALEYLSNPELRASMDDSVTERFRDIINAQYRGPQSLRAAGLYDLAQGRVRDAQGKIDLAKRADTRQDLLSQMYKQSGTDYSRGLSGLDAALLNTSSKGIRDLVAQNKNIGNLQAELDKAQVSSELAATNRAQEIRDIVAQSKDSFTQGQKSQRDLTEAAINKRQEDAKAFLDQLRSGLSADRTGQTLSSAEAAILGIRGGEGLYGAGADIVKERQLERERLVSRDEQARLAALSRLAGLDQAKTLDTSNLYSDASKAGTQTALDALDREAIRAALVEREENFRNQAGQTTARGVGTGQGSRGGLVGKKTVRSTKELEANVRDALQQSGAYDFNSDIQRDVIGSNDIAQNLANALQFRDQQLVRPGSVDQSVVGSSTDRSGGGVNLGNAVSAYLSLGLDKGVWDSLGNSVGALKPITDLAGNTIGSIPLISDIATGIGNALAGNAVRAKSVADRKAFEAANQALQADFQNKLNDLKLYDRVSVDDTNAEALQRSAALEALLRRLG